MNSSKSNDEIILEVLTSITENNNF